MPTAGDDPLTVPLALPSSSPSTLAARFLRGALVVFVALPLVTLSRSHHALVAPAPAISWPAPRGQRSYAVCHATWIVVRLVGATRQPRAAQQHTWPIHDRRLLAETARKHGPGRRHPCGRGRQGDTYADGS